MPRGSRVERPTKTTEYELLFASREAEKGWRDLKATSRNVLSDAWDFLTATPLQETAFNYPLKGSLSTIVRNGKAHKRWQYKPTAHGDARIWFYVDDNIVHLEQVHTHHPNETK